MVIEIPINLLKSKNTGEEIRREVAIALYKSGLLPLKNAAKFLGVGVADFLRQTESSVDIEPSGNGKGKPVEDSEVILLELSKPIIEGFDFEQILKEQGYKGPNKARFDKIARELDIQEPIEELLATLTK